MNTNTIRNKKGFTLLEAAAALLVTLIALSLLIAMGVFLIQVGVALAPYLLMIAAGTAIWHLAVKPWFTTPRI